MASQTMKRTQVSQRQLDHQVDAGEDRQDRHDRDERRPERARPVRIRPAQDDDADRHQHEGEQRADVGELDDLVDVGERRRRPPRTTPVRIVVTCGVRYFGWTFAAHGGSRPSRAIEKKMRGWPSWNTSSTDVVAKTAPSEMMPAAQCMPSAENAVASGSAVPSSRPRQHAGEHQRHERCRSPCRRPGWR